MPLLEWGRDRDWGAGAGPIPHLGAFATTSSRLLSPGTKQVSEGKVTQYATSSSHGTTGSGARHSGLASGAFPTGRVSAVIQEGVWGVL